MALKKKTTKKTTTKKAAATPVSKKTAERKTAASDAPGAAQEKSSTVAAETKPIADKQTKLQIIQAIAEDTGLARKQVEAVFGSLAGLVRSHMQKRGSGEFTIPEVGVKILRGRRPASAARTGRNPATGEEIAIPPKPAHDVIRLSALKALKDTLT